MIINAPDAANTTRDTVEVSIVQSNAWMINDSDVFDSCAVPTVEDYYWVKEFHLPSGVDDVIVDSISFYFCSGGETIQLLAFDWTETGSGSDRVKYPGQLLSMSGYFETTSGWNTIPANWYISTDTFYLGYLQWGISTPALKIDTSPADTENTGCWTARDVNPNPDSVDLAWYEEGLSQTFAIRAHVIPAFQYLGKPSVGTSTDELWNALELGYKHKGARLKRICPPRHE